MALQLTIQELCRATGGKLLVQPNQDLSLEITGVATDSRSLQRGDCFIALPGEHHDGHEFITEVFGRCATALLVRHSPHNRRNLANLPPAVQITDTVKGLEALGRYYRNRLTATFVGITGSVGKTTTKEMAYQLVSTYRKTVRSQKSFNNMLGVPITILQLAPQDEVAILELGTNGFGEIAHLSGIARPDIGVITCVTQTHLEGLGSIEGVERAKGELLEGMKPDGVLIVNADNPHCLNIARRYRGRSVTFGCEQQANFQATELRNETAGLAFACDGRQWSVPVLGKHNIYNVLAAMSIARELGISNDEIAQRLSGLKLPPLRMQLRNFPRFTVISDCYNSSPQAAMAALDVLRETAGKRKIAILGSMLELGEQSAAIHRKLGSYVVQCQIDELWTVGTETIEMVAGATVAGMSPRQIHHFQTTGEVFAKLEPTLQEGDVVLLKASRRLEFEKILAQIEQQFGK